MMFSHRASLDVGGRPLITQVRPIAPKRRLLTVVNNTIKSYFPDFSHWSGLIDWELTAQYILASILKSSESDWFIDTEFAANKAGSIRTGRAWAAYHFYRDDADPIAQAKHFTDIVGDGCHKYILDVELAYIHSSSAVLTCLQEIKRITGKQPVLYSSKYYWSFVRPSIPISEYDFWTANYGTLYPSAPVGANVVAHQYEISGRIPGVPELGCDENFFYGGISQMWEWFGNGGTLPQYLTYLPIVQR